MTGRRRWRYLRPARTNRPPRITGTVVVGQTRFSATVSGVPVGVFRPWCDRAGIPVMYDGARGCWIVPKSSTDELLARLDADGAVVVLQLPDEPAGASHA